MPIRWMALIRSRLQKNNLSIDATMHVNTRATQSLSRSVRNIAALFLLRRPRVSPISIRSCFYSEKWIIYEHSIQEARADRRDIRERANFGCSARDRSGSVLTSKHDMCARAERVRTSGRRRYDIVEIVLPRGRWLTTLNVPTK